MQVEQVMTGFSRREVLPFTTRPFSRDVCLLSPAFSGVKSGYFRWATFFGAETGFFWFGLLRELFIDLGGNLEKDSMIPREIQGIGARKFMAI
jgi:hypothetical protein